jgi:glutathione S-transferase
MILANFAALFSAVVTILTLILYTVIFMRAGHMRGRHNIVAPAVTGHPEFDRAYRVQMNTIEQLILFLPLLWLATTYFHMVPLLPGAFGLIWIVGRIVYMQAYMANPSSRSLGFMIGALATIGLLILSLIGIVQTWIALSAV